MSHAIDLIVSALMFLAGLIMEFIGFVDAFLASLMSSAGIPPHVQLLILIVVAVALVVGAIRALGGVFVFLIVVLLVLLVVHQADPGLQLPHYDLSVPGNVHT